MQQRFETFTVLIAKISRSIRRIKAEEMSISFEGASRLVSLLSDAAGAANRRAAVRPVRGG